MEDLVFLASTALFSVLAGIFILSVSFVFLSSFRRPKRRVDQPPVTVVIPAYNEAPRIAECIHAAKASVYPHVRVVVVDDGSTDRTRELARKAGAGVLEQDHAGKVAALNRGVVVAKTEFVVTIDADTKVEPTAIAELVSLCTDRIGIVTGIATVANRRSVLGSLQTVEYLYNSLLRTAFARLFRVSPGICGALALYRKAALQEVGGFKATTCSEDFDVAVDMFQKHWSVVATPAASGQTIVPDTVKSLFHQRIRWSRGVLQSVNNHRDALRSRRIAMPYLLGLNIFWAIYSLVAIPIFVYHILYWLPANSGSLFDIGFYFLRWFSFAGPVYMVWMMQYWTIHPFYVLGVFSGIALFVLMLYSFVSHREQITWRSLLAMIFFFPYSILVNFMMIGSVISFLRSGGKGTFVS